MDLDNPELSAVSILQRSAALRRNISTAGKTNLLIPQHCDTLRYARMRGGGTLPVLRRFNVGDYMYHHNNGALTSLDAKVKPKIYHVAGVKPTGVLVLEGRCGSSITAHVTRCAPCHLPIEEHLVDPRLAGPTPGHACESCKFPGHAYVLLGTPAEGSWVCPICVGNGVTVRGNRSKDIKRAPPATWTSKIFASITGSPGYGRREVSQSSVQETTGCG